MNPLKAIRQHCLDCSNGSAHEVDQCPVSRCALHPLRFGKNPFRKKRVLSAEHLAALSGRRNGQPSRSHSDRRVGME